MTQTIGMFFLYLIYLTFIRLAYASAAGPSVKTTTTYPLFPGPTTMTKVTIEDYPFIIGIMRQEIIWGMAALVGKRWALAQANIVITNMKSGQHNIVLAAGASYPAVSEFSPHMKRSAVQEFMVHELYDAEKKTHDIGLLKLVEELEISFAVRPVPFATRHDTHDRDLSDIYKECTLLIYDYVIVGTRRLVALVTLYKLQMVPISRDECNKKLADVTNFTITADFFCMEVAKDRYNIHKAGPLVCGQEALMQGMHTNIRPFLIGDKHVAVFTRMDRHCDWLRHKISSNAMSAFKTITVAIPLVMVMSALM